MAFTPKISIVIPVYNGANYLSEAIDSALAQTYKDIEVIVVNDGSDDEGKTEAIAKLYGNKIRYFYKENGGVASALNLGIRIMTGEYFAWLSHDDIYYPHKIEKQVNFLSKQANKNIAIYSDYEFIDRNSNYLAEKRIPHVEPEKLKFAIISSGPINGCTVLLPRKIFNEIGLFNENLLTIQDYDMWYRISDKCYFIHQREILIKSRLHPDQGIATIDSNAAEMCDFYYRCLKEIDADEMLRISGQKSISAVYSLLAVKYKRRIVCKASLLASQLAKKYLLKDDFFTIGRNILRIGYCDICNLAFLFLKILGLNRPKKYSLYHRLKISLKS